MTPLPASLLSVADVAELLQVPPRTIYAWRSKGEGPPAARIGKYVRFRRGDVENWIARRVGGSAAPDLAAVADPVRTGGRRARRPA